MFHQLIYIIDYFIFLYDVDEKQIIYKGGKIILKQNLSCSYYFLLKKIL
jgi:hypothetical protein